VGLSICLTLHDRKEFLPFCLRSIQHFSPPPYPYEIVIVGDSPSYDIPEILSGFDLPILYVEYSRLHPSANPFNGYCAFGLNLAVRYATYDAILKCNPEDVFVTNLFHAVPSLYHPNRIVFATLIESSKEFRDLVFAGKVPAQDKEKAVRLGGKVRLPPHDKPRLDILLFSRSRFITVGGVDEDFMKTMGNAGEMEDFVERMMLSGAEGIWSNLIEAVHLYHQDLKSALHEFPKSYNLFSAKKRQRKKTGNWVANPNGWGNTDAVIKTIRLQGRAKDEDSTTKGTPAD